MATHSSILAWRIPMDRGAGAWRAAVLRVTKSWTRLSDYARQAEHVLTSDLWVKGYWWRPAGAPAASQLRDGGRLMTVV